MKIRSLLLVGLLVGQVAPVMAMERPKVGLLAVQGLFRKGELILYVLVHQPLMCLQE